MVLKYSEIDAFYVLVHIMYKLEYRHVYDEELSKLRDHLRIIEA